MTISKKLPPPTPPPKRFVGKGGPGRGGGRKPRAIEDNVKGAINAALTEGDMNAIWQKVVAMSKTGSVLHIKILFEYYYGKPKENLDKPQEMTIKVVRE